MSVFNRVHNLVKSHFERMPLEDLTTEFFAGILESDRHLLNGFVKEVLKIEGGDFSITTQKQYNSCRESTDDKNHIRPDMVFSNGRTLCFLENKIESPEHENQLHDYYQVLKRENPKGNYYLRYCTKYYDPKNPMDYGGESVFCQFRWTDISKFLADHEDRNPLLKQFQHFLRSHGMGQIEKFKVEDENTMMRLLPLLNKMDRICEMISPRFKKFFGEPLRSSLSGQITFRNRYGLLSKQGVFGKESSVFVGFDFDTELCDKAPALRILLWCQSENDSLDSQIRGTAKEAGFKTFLWDQIGIGISEEKPLSDFLEIENQQTEINKWFVRKINVISNFMRNNLNSLKAAS